MLEKKKKNKQTNKKQKQKQRKYIDSYRRKKIIDVHAINKQKKIKKVHRFLQYKMEEKKLLMCTL